MPESGQWWRKKDIRNRQLLKIDILTVQTVLSFKKSVTPLLM